jgi:hypothetical protein
MTFVPSELDLAGPPAGDDTARAAAESVYAFAKKYGLINVGDGPPADIEEDEADDGAQVAPAARFEQHAVIDAFRKRPIKLIAYDDARRTVTIFTDRPIGVRVQKQLPHALHGTVNIQYMASGNPEVRGNESDQFAAEPCYVVNGRYACGGSIFPGNRLGAGTFGALLRAEDGTLYGMSNNHVTGGCNHSEPGLPIVAPGSSDVMAGRSDPFTIGHHHTLRPIHDGHPDMIDINENLDVATFTIADADLVSSMQGRFYDTPGSVRPLAETMRVEKVGRTTGHTFGTVIGASVAPVAVYYDVRELGVKKHVFFPGDRVFTVKGDNDAFFSSGGDSGSLVVSTDEAGVKHAVGVVFAGNERNKLSFVLPIAIILEQLGLSLVTAHGVP